MSSILRLTRAGQLIKATKLIQKSLLRVSKSSLLDVNAGIKPVTINRRRHPLGQAVSQLSKLPPKLPRSQQTVEPHIPQGASFQDAAFTCAAGKRSYKLYIPKSLPAQPRGLIVMLHGCTQNAADFATGTRMNDIAESEGLIIAYPDQATRANSSGCWNWFNPNDQKHGVGEPAIIAGITLDIMARHNIDAGRVFIAGLSAGGAMAVIMGHTYPDLYSAIGVHSGLPYRCADDVISAFAAMRGKPQASNASLKPRVIVFQGDADKTVHPSNGTAITANRKKHSEAILNGVSNDGRKFTRTIIKDQNETTQSELWMMSGIGHAWSGGHPAGSYTDSKGPDASKEMVRFFLEPHTDAG